MVGTRRYLDRAAADLGIDLDDVVRTHERGDEGRCRPVPEIFGRADLGDAAGLHDDHAVGHHHGLLAVMGDVQGRDAQPLLQAADLVTPLVADAGVEVGQRLVEQQQAGLDRQRPAQRHVADDEILHGEKRRRGESSTGGRGCPQAPVSCLPMTI